MNVDVPLDVQARKLRTDLALMEDYLQMCVRKRDWHGVMDAAADIREIEAVLRLFPRET